VKAEHSVKGKNPRFLVTNLPGNSRELYEKLYCARGEAENRIMAQQLDLFADRTRCMNWVPNQLRMLLSGLASTLVYMPSEFEAGRPWTAKTGSEPSPAIKKNKKAGNCKNRLPAFNFTCF